MANRHPLVIIAGIPSELPAADKIPGSDIELDTDGTLAANSDAKIASQKAVKTYVTNNASGATPPAAKIYSYFNLF